MDFMAGKERRIFEWSQGARGHYERKRRAELIEKARFLVLQPSRGTVRIEVEVKAQGAEVVDLTEEQTVNVSAEKKHKPVPEPEIKEDTTAWDFDEDDEKKEETKAKQNENTDADGDGWGFEDEAGTDAEPTSATNVDPDDPWVQEWDDPNEVKPPCSPPPKALPASATPKGQPSALIQRKARSTQKESYLVSQVATALASIAEDVLREGSELLESRWGHLDSTTQHRANISCAASSPIVDCPRQAQLSSSPLRQPFLTSSAHSTPSLEPLSWNKTLPLQRSTRMIAYT